MRATDLEITFEQKLSPEIRGLIRSVLLKLVDDEIPHAHVVKLISDGRSGATVFEVSLRNRQEEQGWVVKIGPPDEMAREKENHDTLVAPRATAVCAPLVKHTDNAVAYKHVAAHAGLRHEPTPTLEEVVRQAYQGDDDALRRVLRVLSELFLRLRAPFYDRNTSSRDTASLRSFNPRLGPDLVLSASTGACAPTMSELVFETTIGGGLLKVGAAVQLEHASVDGVSVSTVFGPRPEGVIESIRFDDRRALLTEAVDPAAPVVGADPWCGLKNVLTDPRHGRLRSVGHGDLNPRNILLMGDEFYVIDFAETQDGLPLLWDPTWLEVGLIRDVFAGLPYADLLQLQRVLALACRVRSLVQNPDRVEGACLALLSDGLVVPFKVLFALRLQALSLHRGDDAWENYLALLYFSGYRTLKWQNNNDAERVRAVHAILVTCTEWLAEDTPFRHWTDTGAALKAVASLLDLTKSEAVKLAASLTTGKEPAMFARNLGERLAVHQFRQQATDRYLKLERAHDEYLPLVITDGTRHGDPIVALLLAPQAILVGEPGAGKSSVVSELIYRLARSVARARASVLPQRMPIGRAELPGIGADLLKLGAVHLLIDDATEEDLAWARQFRAENPHTPVLLTMREAPEGTDWPVFRLLPISDEQALDYVARTMIYQLDPAPRQKLVDLITSSNSGIRSPALLRMAIEHVEQYGDIRSVEEVLGRYFGEGYGTDHEARPVIAESVALSVAGNDEVAACARSFARRETCLLAVRLRETPARVVKLLVRAVWTDDPEYAADLLMAAIAPPDGLADELAAALEEVLADPTAGRFHHGAAANALSTLGADKQLARALTAQNAVPDVLDAMRTLWWHSTTAEDRKSRRRQFCLAFEHVLTNGYPAEVVTAVLQTIADMRFTGLELVIADLVPDSPTALTAADTLKRLEVVRPTRLSKVHHGLVRARLNELESLLPTLSDLHEVREAESEREDRLLELRLPAEWEARLNSFGISDTVALWLDRTRTPSESPGQTDEQQALHVQDVFREDRLRGLRLAWSTVREQRWPWVSLLHNLRGNSEDSSALVVADEEGRDCAVRALASRDYHRFTAPRPRIELSPGAREVLASRRESDGVQWALAVAAAGLHENLPDLLQMVDENTAAAVGLLARNSTEAAQAHALLREHNSVIGLAYLGDWVPLLTSPDEATVLRAGANALKRWAFGPSTPQHLNSAEATARWLDDALRTQTLTPERRSLFAELKRHMEKKDGKLVSRP